MLYLYGVTNVSNISDEDYHLFYQNISIERQERVDKYHFKIDKIRCALAEILLKYMLSECLSIEADVMSIKKNDYGKPAFVDYHNVFFNVSHSGEWILCAIADADLGVDVEQINKDNMNIAKSFFSVDEFDYLMQCEVNDRKEIFYKFWTLKESYIKAVGKGLNISLKSFSFDIENEINLIKNLDGTCNYSFWSEKIDEQHYASLCYKKEKNTSTEIALKIISIKDLITWIKK